MIDWKKYIRVQPKQRTIHQIHDIWYKAKSRSLVRRERFTNFINQVTSIIEPNDKGNYIIYFNYKDNKIGSIILSFNGRFGGWSFYTEQLNIDKDRDKTLSYWLADDSITELGNKFRELDDDRGFRLESLTREILDRKVNDYFRKYFEKLKQYPPESFITKISDKDYIIVVDDRLNFPKFKIANEVTEPIIINEPI